MIVESHSIDFIHRFPFRQHNLDLQRSHVSLGQRMHPQFFAMH